MAQRTVCLCDGKYIGIETIFTVVDGRQINIPGKVEELRARSRKNELFCPCGCGSNLILVAGDKNLREQHFRLKDGASNANCSAVTEGSVSLNSKIVLKCWLDDKFHATDLETRVPIRSLENGSLNSKNGGRKYEFSFLSAEKKIALSYTHERANLSDEKFDALERESKRQEIQILYVVDEANSGNTGQYPEGLMKIQRRQGHLLFLNIKGSDYAKATLHAAFYEKDIDGHWQERPVYDRDGNRWIRCEFCGKIDRDSSFVSYGGKNHVNLGTCKECETNNPAVREKAAAAKMQAARRRDQNTFPECGGTLTLRNGRFGSFYGCSNFLACRYTRRA